MKARLPLIAALVLGGATLGACATDGEDGLLESTAERTGEVVDDIEGSAVWQRIEGNWKQFSGAAKERWAELTDDEIGELDGNKDQLVGKIQETYGIGKGEAEEQVDEWAASL